MSHHFNLREVSICSIFFLICLSMSWSVNSKGATLEFQPLLMDLDPQDQVFVRGYDGELRISPAPADRLTVQVRQINRTDGSQLLRESQDDWLFSVEKVEKGVEVKVKSPPMKSVWVEALKTKHAPRFVLEIQVPKRTIDLVWQSGTVSVDRWNGPMVVHLSKGQLTVGAGAGQLKASVYDGSLNVQGRQGNLEIESFKSQVRLSRHEGEVSLLNFSGTSLISQVRGGLTLKGFDGRFTVSESEGSIDFNFVRSPFRVSGHRGDVRGQTEQGGLLLQLLKFGELQVRSTSADVSLELPASGANMTLITQQGQIYAPAQFNIVRSAQAKSLRGRLSGKEPGRVSVRTESGNIRLRSS